MSCGVCGRSGHNSVTCPHDGGRLSLTFAGPRSRRCECCGQYGYDIQRHHTRGRGDDSDYLDLCNDCHLQCGHDGHLSNIAMKPRFCRVTDRESWWRA
jgi:hypothetical protein